MQLLVYTSVLLITILTLILSIYSLRAPTWIRFDTPTSSPFQFSSIYGLTQKCDKSNLHPEFQCRPFPQFDRDCQPKSKDVYDIRNMNELVINQTTTDPNRYSSSHKKPSKFAPLGSGIISVNEIDANDSDGQPREGFGFCEKWITAAYTAQLSVVIGVVNLFSTFLILIGNSYRQERGWKICAGLLSLHAIFQTLAWILIINVFNEDDRFYFGSRLSYSTYISIITSVIDLIILTALVAAGLSGILNSSTESSRNDYERIR